MRSTAPAIIFLGLLLAAPVSSYAEPIGGTQIHGFPSTSRGTDISVQYINLARLYREQGRYELARQAYAQAISTCRSDANLEIIKREMAGVELLIRTMR